MKLQIITQKEQEGITTILLEGIIDVYTYGQLEQTFKHLIEQRIYKFIVDLSKVDYLSSAGAGVFMSMLGVVQENNGNIVLVNLKPIVKDVFELLGLTQLFTITTDRKTALESFT